MCMVLLDNFSQKYESYVHVYFTHISFGWMPNITGFMLLCGMLSKSQKTYLYIWSTVKLFAIQFDPFIHYLKVFFRVGLE